MFGLLCAFGGGFIFSDFGGKAGKYPLKSAMHTSQCSRELFEPRPHKEDSALKICQEAPSQVISEIAKPRVRKRCHPDPPPKPPTPPPKTCPCRSLHSTIHSYTFPYKEGRVVRDLEGVFKGGLAIYENPVGKRFNPSLVRTGVWRGF